MGADRFGLFDTEACYGQSRNKIIACSAKANSPRRNQGTRRPLTIKAQVSTPEDIKDTIGTAGFAKAQGTWHYKAAGGRQEVRLSVDNQLSHSAEQAQG
ncbi:MAG: hypothetical protein ACYTE5_01520 [Planctomycetota bacterium]